MKIFLSILIGYLLGSISPSYFISKKKNIDLRKKGTGNLGATNTFMILGKAYGAFVMFFDIFKAYLAVRLAELFFPNLIIAGIAAGGASVLGHNYPFYLKFKGGKGIAAFAGYILALNWKYFLVLLFICLIIAIISNYSCMLSISAAILFPFMTMADIFRHREAVETSFVIVAALTLIITSASIIYKHTDNLKKIASGEEIKFRTFLSRYILSSKKDK